MQSYHNAGLVQPYVGGITEENFPDRENRVTEILEAGSVLLVDDESIFLQITSAMLSRLGFTVFIAMDGIEAMEVFRQHKNDIRFVLSDVAMPRMDGFETMIALRQIVPGLPVILTSGCSEKQIMDGARPERPQAFLAKPFGFQALKDTVQRILTD